MDDVKFLGQDGSTKRKMSRNKKLLLVFSVLIAVLIVIVVCATQISSGGSGDAGQPIPDPWRQLRLPTSVKPILYNLSLDIYVDQHKYNGNVSILVRVEKNTKLVLIHKVFIKITKTVIETNNGGLVSIKNLFYFNQNEFWVIELNEELTEGNEYVIKLRFNARIRRELSGFHRGSYKDKLGKDIQLASTFFSPISARTAFPCFDEPNFKASFQITLTHEKKYHPLSNMPESGRQISGDRLTTSFEPSLNMSTYIVSWAITDFHSTEFEAGHLKLKGWLPRNKNVSEIRYGLNVTAQLLPKYEEYFDIPFPLKKLDVVALPQFAPSAMENWGLILFRQSKFLKNSQTTYDEDKDIVQIMGHELVHQWFGNLATMEFWNEAWLKEGFATYIAYIAFDELYPSKEFMKDVLPNYMLEAMHLDSFSSSVPISREINTPDEIREVFDQITYYKGCCMVQTLFWYMGKESFKKGMQRYLKTFSYGNANQDDLWRELSAVANGKDIKAVMDTWTKQLGYPVISTRRINKTHVEIEQKRFSLDQPGKVPPKSPFNYQWQIPILTRDIKTGIGNLYLLKEKKGTFPITSKEIINPNHYFFYRVDYDKDTYHYLTNELSDSHVALTELDRTGFISDNFNLFKAKIKSLTDTIKVLTYIKNETEQVVWNIAMKEMMEIHHLLEEHPTYHAKWREFILSNIKDIAFRLSWKKQNTYRESALQTIILTHACKLNVTFVVEEAKIKFRDWMEGNLDIDRNLYPVIRGCSISNAVEEDSIYFQYTYEQYLKTRELSLLYSLAQTKHEKLVERLLQASLNTSIVNNNDATYFIGKIAESSLIGRLRAWQFVKKNWSTFMDRYGNNIFLLGRMITSVLKEVSSLEVFKDVEEFFSVKLDVGSSRDSIMQSLSEIISKSAYKDTILKDKWFENS